MVGPALTDGEGGDGGDRYRSGCVSRCDSRALDAGARGRRRALEPAGRAAPRPLRHLPPRLPAARPHGGCSFRSPDPPGRWWLDPRGAGSEITVTPCVRFPARVVWGIQREVDSISRFLERPVRWTSGALVG